MLHISHKNLLVANRVFGDKAITSALGSGWPGWLLFFLGGGDRRGARISLVEETLASLETQEVKLDILSSKFFIMFCTSSASAN